MQGIWNDVKIGGATIGAKTSVYSQKIWGQLVSNFTLDGISALLSTKARNQPDRSPCIFRPSIRCHCYLYAEENPAHGGPEATRHPNGTGCGEHFAALGLVGVGTFRNYHRFRMFEVERKKSNPEMILTFYPTSNS